MHCNVAHVKMCYPEKEVMMSEACCENFSSDRLHHWANGERYGASMIHDFNSGAVAWTDWNILLDVNGGPNHVDNFCFLPLLMTLSTRPRTTILDTFRNSFDKVHAA